MFELVRFFKLQYALGTFEGSEIKRWHIQPKFVLIYIQQQQRLIPLGGVGHMGHGCEDGAEGS